MWLCFNAAYRKMDGSTNYVISESPWSLTEHGRKAELKLKSNVYDLEAWSILIREAQVRKFIRPYKPCTNLMSGFSSHRV